MMTREQILLTKMLKRSLASDKADASSVFLEKLTSKDWNDLVKVSDLHKVTGLLYRCVENLTCVPGNIKEYIRKAAVKTSLQNFRMLFLSRDIIRELEDKGIRTMLLKGQGAASFYPEPLYRKSGDVDIFLPDESRLDEAIGVLEGCGLKVKEYQRALHHTVLTSDEDLDVELHTLLCEPLDNDKANRCIKGCGYEIRDHFDDRVIEKEILGAEIPVLRDPYFAYELLLHMLQHYLRSGFGIRLLCDWVVFWNRDVSEEETAEYLKFADDCGIRRFSDMITLACYRYLGLKKEAVYRLKAGGFTKEEIDGFFDEFMNAGEFGKTSKARMVALRGNGLPDYIREFHHQMKLNYPKESSNVLLWPSLWIATLVIFLENNKKIRNISLREVMDSAGKRGKMNAKLRLFEK